MRHSVRALTCVAAALVACAISSAAAAQTRSTLPPQSRPYITPTEELPSTNITVGLGPGISPAFPGDSSRSIRLCPQIEVWESTELYPPEAPDEGISIPLVGSRQGGGRSGDPRGRTTWSAGLTFTGAPQRDPDDVGRDVDNVGFGLELGGYTNVQFGQSLRLRAEARHAIGAHGALTADLRADVIGRIGNTLTMTIGPRLRWGSSGFNGAYFGIDAAESGRSGLAAYDPGSGIYAAGVLAGAQLFVSRDWGLYGFAGYDRLMGPATRSPIVTVVGSRDQLSAGIALTYTFRVYRQR